MAGMFFSGDKGFMSFGIATMMVVGNRDARLAHRAARAAVEARRQGREGQDPVPAPAPAQTAARTGSGRRSSPPLLRRPARRRGDRGRGARRPGRPGAAAPHRQSGLDALPNSAPTVRARSRRSQKAFPTASRSRRSSRSRRTTRLAPSTQQAISELKSQALASGQMHGPIEVTRSTPSHTVARVTIPLAGKGTDAVSNAALDTLRERHPAGHGRARSPARPTRSPAPRRPPQTRTRC